MKSPPIMLDLITLCVERDLNLTGAIHQAVDKGPAGALKDEYARAEKLAMEAAVKLLFPLIFFIFLCVFAILMFSIVIKFMASGT